MARDDARWSLDLDTGPQPLTWAVPIAKQEQVSQELQLQSGAASPIQWVAGVYFIRIDERYDPTVSHYLGSYSVQLGGGPGRCCSAAGSRSPTPPMAKRQRPSASRPGLTLGLRYTIEDRSVEANAERLFSSPPLVRRSRACRCQGRRRCTTATASAS
jgi:hypothetical protein